MRLTARTFLKNVKKMTSRKFDENGYMTVESNPITQVGVFQYLGRSIGADEPDKVYNVYRPAEELGKQECVDSFKNLPIIDDHTMLGPAEDGFTPPEKKGVHGSTGDAVRFADNKLLADLKFWGQGIIDKIKSGKKDLSLGYRCIYDKIKGVFEGQAYDYVQRDLRGNHLALVDQARCDVAVRDHHITLDHFDLNLTTKDDTQMPPEEVQKPALTLEAVAEKLDAMATKLDAVATKVDEMATPPDETVDKVAADKAAADKAAAELSMKDAEGEEAKKAEAQDAAIAGVRNEMEAFKKNGVKAFMAEIAKRDTLASQLSKHIGTFDHSDKTVSEVAKYGVEKLGLKCAEGQEEAVLSGYLHNRDNSADRNGIGLDSMKVKSSEVDAYINGSK